MLACGRSDAQLELCNENNVLQSLRVMTHWYAKVEDKQQLYFLLLLPYLI